MQSNVKGGGLWRRRDVLGAAAATFACATVPATARVPAAKSRITHSRDTPGIDIHCHVFNAADLPMDVFARHVIVNTDENAFSAGLIDPFFRRSTTRLVDLAPSFDQEMEMVSQLLSGRCPTVGHERTEIDVIAALLNDIPAIALVPALPGIFMYEMATGEKPRSPNGARLDPQQCLPPLCPPTASLTRDLAARMNAFDGKLGHFFRWSVTLTRYRTRLIENLFQLYGRGENGVRIVTPALIDFSMWIQDRADEKPSATLLPEEQVGSTPKLNECGIDTRGIVGLDRPSNEPKTSLDRQATLMTSIVRLYEGRVHPFIAFDPARELAYRLGKLGGSLSPLELVRDAIEHGGFIGVKVYPPMGFRPIGNAAFDAGVDANARHFPDALKRYFPDFGAQLDTVLASLYDYCVDHDVPIMAHCRDSNEAADSYGDRAHPAYWGRVLHTGRWRNLRINFGHFGDTYALSRPDFPEEDWLRERTPDQDHFWAWTVARLVANPDMPNAYADLSFAEKILEGRDFDAGTTARGIASTPTLRFARTLRLILDAYPAVANKLMFGSDWNMLGFTLRHESYLDRFSTMVASRFPELSGSFFGRNAARYLGLFEFRDDGGHSKTYRRLRAFYDFHKMHTARAMQDKFFAGRSG